MQYTKKKNPERSSSSFFKDTGFANKKRAKVWMVEKNNKAIQAGIAKGKGFKIRMMG